ncbi:transposase [Barnesiella sp. WM24]|uniref:transposase n=1 Tax=Barnesiella sp. WM24 TaxID=2558278 RepID=UPI001FD7B4FB|nr:transposase [Barnesiella sp. WM24]
MRFSTTENMTADKVADFLDRLSLRIRKNTFVVLDNASVHRCKLMRELRSIWEKRGLYLFFLPPYSPHLNIAETLWRILKGNGSDLRIIAPQIPCSMQPTVHWLHFDLNSISILPMRLSIN